MSPELAPPARRATSIIRRVGPLALTVLLALASCGGGDPADDAAAGDRAAATTTGEGGAAGTGGAAGHSGDGGTGGSGGETGGTGDTGETGDTGGGGDARFNLVASPDNVECSYVPNGHLSGADLLNVHFYFLIIGGNPPDVPAVSVTVAGDTGLATSYSSGPHNQAVSTAQLALRPEDFGRSHALTLTVDATGQVTETDESDNRIGVRVSLPSPRPSSAIDPLACSAARA